MQRSGICLSSSPSTLIMTYAWLCPLDRALSRCFYGHLTDHHRHNRLSHRLQRTPRQLTARLPLLPLLLIPILIPILVFVRFLAPFFLFAVAAYAPSSQVTLLTGGVLDANLVQCFVVPQSGGNDVSRCLQLSRLRGIFRNVVTLYACGNNTTSTMLSSISSLSLARLLRLQGTSRVPGRLLKKELLGWNGLHP